VQKGDLYRLNVSFDQQDCGGVEYHEIFRLTEISVFHSNMKNDRNELLCTGCVKVCVG